MKKRTIQLRCLIDFLAFFHHCAQFCFYISRFSFAKFLFCFWIICIDAYNVGKCNVTNETTKPFSLLSCIVKFSENDARAQLQCVNCWNSLTNEKDLFLYYHLLLPTYQPYICRTGYATHKMPSYIISLSAQYRQVYLEQCADKNQHTKAIL